MTAKEMADKARCRFRDVKPRLRQEVPLIVFTPKKFDDFCEQLCREQKRIDGTVAWDLRYSLPADSNDVLAPDQTIMQSPFPDWGQKGGE